MTVLRTIAAADAELLAALHGACFPDDPWGPASMREILALPGSFGLLAASAVGEPDGFVLAHAAGEEIEVLALAALRQRRGIGRALLNRLLAMARQRRQVVFLEVAEDNAPARALYTECGFRAVGRRPAYYRRRDGTSIAALQLRCAP